MYLSLYKIKEFIYQIRNGEKSSSMLSRYGILKGEGVLSENSEACSVSGRTVSFSGKRKVDLSVKEYGERHTIEISLSEGERFYGLGDSSRDGIQLRGKEILLENEIEILISVGDGEGKATAWGCDLTYDYVKINGDYRT